MRSPVVSGLVWWTSASVLLCAGFLATVYAASLLAAARTEPGALRQLQTALVIYARVVLVKGLLPQLLLALGLWALLDRAFALGARGRRAVVLGVVGAAAAASLLVAPTLLPLALPGLPAVSFRGPGNFLRTCLEMTAAVSLAALVPRLGLPGLRPAGGAAPTAQNGPT